MKKVTAVTCVVLLSFASGMLGSTLFEFYLFPRLYNQHYKGLTSDLRPIVQPEIVRTKIFESSVSEVAKEVSPAVVSIVVSKDIALYYQDPYEFFFNDPFFSDPFFYDAPFRTPPKQQEQKKERTKIGGGTGFFVTEDGMIVTNKHVVEDTEAEYTAITSDGREFAVQVVAKDPVYDIALVRLVAKEGESLKGFPTVKFGNSDELQIGQFVVAIGNALAEYENSVTMGVVSAKGRKITAGNGQGSSEQLSNLIQTDAAINPGNSGGPLVNLEGEVIGINTAMASQAQGIGFAIPINQVKQILPSVEKYGKIVYPYLGVNYQMITKEMQEKLQLPVSEGALIMDNVEGNLRALVKDGPGEKAGLKSGDIITKVNGEAVNEKQPLQDLILKHKAGDMVSLTILRDTKELTVKVTLGERPLDPSEKPVGATPTGNGYLGISYTMITPDKAKAFGLPVEYGALLEHNLSKGTPAVEKDSPAAKAGLRSGDIITKVGDIEVKDQDIATLLGKFSAGDKVTLTYVRDGKSQTIEVTFGSRP